MTRLTSEAHAKPKTPEPIAYNWVLEHFHNVPNLLAYVGDRARRDYLELYPHVKKIPPKLKLTGSPVKRASRAAKPKAPKQPKNIPLAAKPYETLCKK